MAPVSAARVSRRCGSEERSFARKFSSSPRARSQAKETKKNANMFANALRTAVRRSSSLVTKAHSGKNKAALSAAAMEKVDSEIPQSVSPDVAVKYGFEVVKEEYVKEYGSNCVLYRHGTTGAELMSVHNRDENKTFGAVFRTPVEDSTGVPHILEHSVLCGSRKYPIKEPFVELIKGSLNTFLNAMTYPDRTCYPVASCNLADFYNLVDVYLDAVFHPKCIENERTFEQ